MSCTPLLWLGLQRTHYQLEGGDTMTEARLQDVETKEKSDLQASCHSLVQRILLILQIPTVSLCLSG